MATAITPQFGNTNCPQLRLTVTVTSNTASQAVLSWSLDYVAHGYAASTSVAKSYTAVIVDQTVSSGTTSINGVTGTKTIDSGTKTIDKTDSAQTIFFSCSMGFNLTWGGVYGGTKSGSGSIFVDGKTTYTISYNANGGTGAPSSQTKFHGTAIVLSNSTPSRSGYIFQGWATSSSGSVQYQPGNSYTANESVTLYAVWSTNSYTVTYNANGGAGAPSSQTKQHGVTLKLSSVFPTRSNHTFMGWGVSAASTTVAYFPGDNYTKNTSITLYAVWEYSYNAPRITNVAADRCTSSGTLNEEGTYGKVAFDWVTNSSVDTIAIQYRAQSSSSSWATVNVSASGTSGSVSRVIGGSFNVETAYEVRVTVSDSNGSSYYNTTVPAMSYILDFLKGGNGVAIGGPSTAVGLEIVMDSTFRGGVGIGTDAPTDNTVEINRKTTFKQPVEVQSDLNVSGNLGLDKSYAIGFKNGSNFYPFLRSNIVNHCPMFSRNLILDYGIYLQAMNSNDSPIDVLRAYGTNVELYWTTGGLKGNVFRSLYSGSVSIGGSMTSAYFSYYRLYAMVVSGVNSLLIGGRQYSNSTPSNGEKINFFSLYAADIGYGAHVASCTFRSSNRLTYTAGKNVDLYQRDASELGNITEIWGIL